MGGGKYSATPKHDSGFKYVHRKIMSRKMCRSMSGNFTAVANQGVRISDSLSQLPESKHCSMTAHIIERLQNGSAPGSATFEILVKLGKTTNGFLDSNSQILMHL